jgi:hypothetical protein
MKAPENRNQPDRIMSERFAIYFAPAADHALMQLGDAWLNGGAAPDGIGGRALEDATKQARSYGFHATLKAPMRLADGYFRADLEQALSDFSRDEPPVAIGEMEVAILAGFLALIPKQQSMALTDFAATCVTMFDRFRAPMSEAEKARRQPLNLSERQQVLLEQYGYPYVMEEFRFHMTLCDQLQPETQETMQKAAEKWMAPALGQPVLLDRIVLFHQPESGARFQRLSDYELTGH